MDDQAPTPRRPMLRSRRGVIVAVAIVAVVVLAAVLGGNVGSLFRSQSKPLRLHLEPAVAPGGEVTTFTVSVSEAGGTLVLPWMLLPKDDNGTYFDITRNVTLVERTWSFTALVMPARNETGTNMTNLTYVKGERNATAPLERTNGTSPLVSGQGFYDNLAYLTSNYPHRQTGRRDHYAAAAWIEGIFTAQGYESETHHYRWSDRIGGVVGFRPIVPRPLGDILVVTGIKRGEVDDEWIVIGGHFDDAANDRSTGEGAYDDGAGTSLMLEYARALSDIPLRHTVMFAAWGGEEEGLYGSDRWVTNDVPPGVSIKFYLNLDMTGISYPNPSTFHSWVGPDMTEGIDHPVLFGLVENLTYEGMGMPRDLGKVELIESDFGRSDHVSFWHIDTPTVFFIGELDTYPYYHTPDDTLAKMEEFVGGKENLIAGFDVAAWNGMLIVLAVDADDQIHQGEVDYQ